MSSAPPTDDRIVPADNFKRLALACVAYDEALRSCANDPERMASFCTARGEDLDALYVQWASLAYWVLGRAWNPGVPS